MRLAADSRISEWVGRHSGFLQTRSAADRTRIVDLTFKTATALEQWAQQWPRVRRDRILALSLTFAASAPFAGVESLVLAARLTLWIFLLDDLFDEDQLPEDELLRRAERYGRLAQGTQAASPHDSAEQILSDMRAELSRYPLFETLERQWTLALQGTIAGMVREHAWAAAYRTGDTSALPAYDEYIGSGLYSIGAPPHLWTSLILLANASITERLPALRAMVRTASISIRLANDLRSADREIAEGKVNALVVLQHAGMQRGLTPDLAIENARAHLQGEITAKLSLLVQMRARAPVETGGAEALISDLAHFVCEFYSEQDFHTFASGAPATNAALPPRPGRQR